MPNQLTKLCTHQLPADLFQTAVNEISLVIDSRQSEEIFLTFISLETGEVVSEQQAKITPWHTLVGIKENEPLLQYFVNKKNPDQLKFFIYNRSNDILVPYEGEILSRSFHSPTTFLSGSENFDTVKQFMQKEIVLGCEYHEVGEYAIMTYYLEDNEAYNRHLTVYLNDELKLEIVQDKNLKGFAPGSFFTTENRLIFARNKNQIHIYEI